MNEERPELAIRAKPRSVRQFSSKAIIGGGGVLSVVLCGALSVALQTPTYDDATTDELYNVTHKPMADGLELLPKSYAEIRPLEVSLVKPKLGPPLPGDLGAAYIQAKSEKKPITPYKPVNRTSYSSRASNYNAAAPVQNEAMQISKSGLFFLLRNNQGQGAPGGNQSAPTVSYPILPNDYPTLTQTPFGYQLSAADSDPNNQETKLAFLEQEVGDIYNSHNLQSPRSPYQVMAGTLIPASLITGLNSDLPGQVIGQVTENVYDTVSGEYLLIPQGARLMGRYDSVIAFGQSRALVVWTRLIFPNGASIQLDNLPATDGQGFAGLKDKVDRHTWQFIKGVALSSLLSVGSELSSDSNDRLTRALQNAGQDTANIAGQRIIDRNLNVQPTLKVRPGWRFNVIVSRDLILKPYGVSQ